MQLILIQEEEAKDLSNGVNNNNKNDDNKNDKAKDVKGYIICRRILELEILFSLIIIINSLIYLVALS